MSDNPAPPPSAPPAAPSAPAREERTAAGLLGIVVAQASFVVAIMYFLGAVYMTAYYSYFRLDSFSLGLGFAEMAIQSLSVVTVPTAIVCVLAVLVARHLATTPPPTTQSDTDEDGRQRLIRMLESALRAVARAHFSIVGSGLALLLLWPWLGGFRWTAPLLLGVGVLLGQSPWAQSRATDGDAAAPSRTWSRAVPVFTAGLLVMWGLSLATGALGEQEARRTAANLIRHPAVVLLSTDRLSLSGPGLEVKDLGAKAHYRYQYTGLRRLIERNGRYYLLPLGWTYRTGPTYVIQDGGDLRIELFPGTQEECGAWCMEG
ncbi:MULTISPECIES: hypothetical protein [unclassified Streptomyces]|uniref:hypothetical protein n=1 Tax=unclassified Streptomyces TaxID=2593676 RepID=UPI00087F90F0|nr:MULTISPECIES: hypothetical protein [unclassified Streptomyces]PBC83282.1 hypothetical protein BX261_3215 [Streptomyces sp. 2321.6]SDR43709.1 hypothetical protein SAMN05216511_3986 [Streptomyces sp. KS_16]SEC91019.1 hypothetical protein SAMN05428940_3217 [Streptomyces sp. 2133.1]SNC69360.1 hypothetical protein SAMN06272741_3209 [Streptomyces sp. 2114.4]